MKTHKGTKAAAKTDPYSGLFENYRKVKLKRQQYISNLLTTNETILRNNNINTLLLF